MTKINRCEDLEKLVAKMGFLPFFANGIEDFSIEEFKAMGWELSQMTYDLHAAPVEGDVETEYEEKFSRKGNPVCRLVARRP